MFLSYQDGDWLAAVRHTYLSMLFCCQLYYDQQRILSGVCGFVLQRVWQQHLTHFHGRLERFSVASWASPWLGAEK
jgi:hypothetical protein